MSPTPSAPTRRRASFGSLKFLYFLLYLYFLFLYPFFLVTQTLATHFNPAVARLARSFTTFTSDTTIWNVASFAAATAKDVCNSVSLYIYLPFPCPPPPVLFRSLLFLSLPLLPPGRASPSNTFFPNLSLSTLLT
jgi:hypothetical protein